MTTLTPDTLVLRNTDLFSAEIDDELVMMDEEQGVYFGLNPIAKALWGFLATPLSYADLLTKVTDLYDVDRQECERDIEPFLQELVKNKLVTLKL